MPNAKPIPYMRPDLPPLKSYTRLLEETWRTRRLSNYGPHALALEAAARRWLGGPRPNVACISAASGDAALYALLRGELETAGRGHDRVLVCDWTFQSTANAARRAGFDLVLAPAHVQTLLLDLSSIPSFDNRTPRVVLATLAHGSTSGLRHLAAGCKATGRKLFLDAAHAFRPWCPLADGAAFSLSGTKTVTAGEGGLVAFPGHERTDRGALARRTLNYGFVGHDYAGMDDHGVNGKMSELHAALALLSMERFEAGALRRRQLAARYRRLLRGVVGFQKFTRQDVPKDFVVRFNNPGEAVVAESRLRSAGVETRRYFRPLSSQPAYAHVEALEDVRERGADLYDRTLCLPFYPGLTMAQVERVARIVAAAATAVR